MSDFIKGVQVGNEVKKYDYEALGNKPSLVEVDNTLTQSGKAADAKIVGDKLSPKKLVLLETITVGENTQRIVRKNTTDNIPYNLSALYLTVEVPASTNTNGGYITLLNGSTYVAYSPIDVLIDTKTVILNYWIDNFYGVAIPYWKYADAQVAAPIRSRVRINTDAFLPITSISIETDNEAVNFPSGTVINIYGIND